jgi:hypothetical protein
MDNPKVYRELEGWIAEWPDGTFIFTFSKDDLEQHIDAFMASGYPPLPSHIDAYTVAVACLVGALVVLGGVLWSFVL